MIDELNKKLNFKINSIEKLHFGENKSFILESDSKRLLLKVYRTERGFKQTPEQEISFIQYLAKFGVKTSEYLKFKNGRFTEKLDDEEISIQEIINGYMIFEPDNFYYHRLGQDLRKLHSCTKELNNDFNLPTYDFFELVEKRWSFVETAKFLKKSDLDKIKKYKTLVFNEVGKKLKNHSNQFIHFDAHTGNLIFNKEDTFFIDWEESGFGYHLLDIAVPCTHLMRDENRTSKIDSLLEGYGGEINRRELNLITITKFLYSMTHIPTRLDILKEPETIFKRYIEYFEFLSSEY